MGLQGLDELAFALTLLFHKVSHYPPVHPTPETGPITLVVAFDEVDGSEDVGEGFGQNLILDMR